MPNAQKDKTEKENKSFVPIFKKVKVTLQAAPTGPKLEIGTNSLCDL